MSCPASPGPASPSLSDRFTCIVGDLCRAVAARGSRQHALIPLMVLLWSRLRRLDARFQALVARVRAGLVSPTSPPAAPRPPTTRSAASSAPRRFPQGFAWLVRLMPEAASYGTQLQHLLTDADMPALLAAEPRLGRLLRPLLHMLAIRPGPELDLAPRRAPASCSLATGSTATAPSLPPPPRRKSKPKSKSKPKPKPKPRPNWRRSAATRPAALTPHVFVPRFART